MVLVVRNGTRCAAFFRGPHLIADQQLPLVLRPQFSWSERLAGQRSVGEYLPLDA